MMITSLVSSDESNEVPCYGVPFRMMMSNIIAGAMIE